MFYSPKKMQDILDKNEFKFKKNFGQNFIIDENIINRIIDLSLIDKDTLVIEIGPGAGSLTYKLAKSAKNVLCYEIDHRLENILKDNLNGIDNVEVIYKDFLLANVKEDLKSYSYKKLYVVANLPYYITTPIIMKLIEDKIDVEKIVVMVQKEVGDRFTTKPGNREYGSITVFLNYFYDIRKEFFVSRKQFIPEPNVDSLIISFKEKEERLELKDFDLFERLIRDSFQFKRKTLKNNLKNYDLKKVSSVLSLYGFDLSVRAEALSTEVFVKIANELVK